MPDLEQKVEERTRELTEALEQQTATAEILRVISSSPTDIQPVFDAIVAKAPAPVSRHHGSLYRFDGDLVRCAAVYGQAISFEVVGERRRLSRVGLPPGRC